MKFEENADGSAIVKLDRPVTFKGEDYARLTIPKLKGKHLRKAPWYLIGSPRTGELAEFAANVIEPEGVFDELDAMDARDIALHVGAMLGKRQATGDERSPG
jgi:hypothetical protein